MTILEDFCKTIRKLTDTVSQLCRLEEQKATIASEKQHARMEPLLRKEQALILSLRGLEKQRMEQAEELGWKDLTFHQIMTQADPEQQETLSPLFAELQKETGHLKQTREAADRIVQVRLRELETACAAAQKASGMSAAPHFQDKYV